MPRSLLTGWTRGWCAVFISVLLVCCCLGSAQAAIDSDKLLASLKPSGFVNDYAKVFDSGQKNALEQTLSRAAANGGPEVVVVALPSLEGGDINDFANKLFARWGIGKKGKDNGVLLLAAVQDRVMRIEVGYGLEGSLTDAGAGRIRDRVIIPQFKEGRYADGLSEGAQAILTAISDGSGAEPDEETPEAPGWFIVLFWVLIILLAIRFPKLFFFLSLFGGRGGRSGGGFGGFGGGRSGGGGASGRW